MSTHSGDTSHDWHHASGDSVTVTDAVAGANVDAVPGPDAITDAICLCVTDRSTNADIDPST